MEVDPSLNGPIVRTADAADDIKSVADFVLRLRGLSQHAAIGWSWGTSTMTRYVSLNPTKVSKLVIYAPQWFRPANTAPTAAYRIVNRDSAFTRWVTGLTQPQITALLPGDTFDRWWNATVLTDPTADTRSPASIRAPNGIQLDNSFFWGNDSAPYDIEQLICPVLVVRGDLDLDLNLNMSQSYYNALYTAPYRKFTQISMGTHTVRHPFPHHCNSVSLKSDSFCLL
jgi:pimeloyl-ACP methyl ester carboxylesterase